MKFVSTIAALARLAVALPMPSTDLISIEDLLSWRALEARENELKGRASSDTRNELSTGGTCPPVILIFARGSTQSGNLGSLGPPLADALEANYGADKVWIQGVGGKYTAGLLDNFLTDGTTAAAITEMKNLLILANSKCPSAKIVAGGYSQGAALVAAAIRDSSATIREQIKGVVLFGYTKNKQNNELIVNYPASRLKVYCEKDDGVCSGGLSITPAHSTYGDEAAGVGPQFLIERINAS